MAEAFLNSMQRHTWYLTEELVHLSLGDDDIGATLSHIGYWRGKSDAVMMVVESGDFHFKMFHEQVRRSTMNLEENERDCMSDKSWFIRL